MLFIFQYLLEFINENEVGIYNKYVTRVIFLNSVLFYLVYDLLVQIGGVVSNEIIENGTKSNRINGNTSAASHKPQSQTAYEET